MIDYLDVYTRISFYEFSNIIVNYYTIGGNRLSSKVILIGPIDFEYIVVQTEKGAFNIPFFSEPIMIESIKLDNSDKLLYYNPYVSKDIYDGDYISTSNVDKIKEKVLGKKEFNLNDKGKLKAIQSHICKYQAKHIKFEYDELFFSEKQKEEFEEFFEVLIKEITNYCKKNGLDTELKLLDKGTTSLVYSIGDKIIKIGKPRIQSNVPYCEYLLQPIINKDYYFDDYPIHIEVTQKVLAYEDIKNKFKDDKKLKEIISDLREKLSSIGLQCYDLHEGNIGILLSDNKIHYDSIEFDIGDGNVTSIQDNNNLNIRGPGEFVIIDLDCLDIIDMEKYTNYLNSLGFPVEDSAYRDKSK